VEPGSYNVLATVKLGAPLMNVHGATGQPRPVLSGSVEQLLRMEGSGTLAYLDLEEQGTGEGLFAGGGLLDRMLVRGKPSGQLLCQCYDGTIRDSVFVAGPGSTSGAVGVSSNAGTSKETLRNDTIYSESPGGPAIQLSQAAASGALELTAYNTIAVNGAGGKDVSASKLATITMIHSDYASPVGPGIVTDGGGRLTSPPLFAHPAGGDFRELGGSPTIDAGLTEEANGPLDFEGNPRTTGATTDIGALEYQPPKSEPPPKTVVPKSPPSLLASGPTVPVVSDAHQSRSRWRRGNGLATITRARPGVGTVFSFSLNEPATVTFAFTQRAGGRIVGNKMRRPDESEPRQASVQAVRHPRRDELRRQPRAQQGVVPGSRVPVKDAWVGHVHARDHGDERGWPALEREAAHLHHRQIEPRLSAYVPPSRAARVQIHSRQPSTHEARACPLTTRDNAETKTRSGTQGGVTSGGSPSRSSSGGVPSGMAGRARPDFGA
jgi:hypothetical protein